MKFKYKFGDIVKFKVDSSLTGIVCAAGYGCDGFNNDTVAKYKIRFTVNTLLEGKKFKSINVFEREIELTDEKS